MSIREVSQVIDIKFLIWSVVLSTSVLFDTVTGQTNVLGTLFFTSYTVYFLCYEECCADKDNINKYNGASINTAPVKIPTFTERM